MKIRPDSYIGPDFFIYLPSETFVPMKKPVRKSRSYRRVSLFGLQNAASAGLRQTQRALSLVGVVNALCGIPPFPQIDPQTDIVVSPWKSKQPEALGPSPSLHGRIPRYFKEHNRAGIWAPISHDRSDIRNPRSKAGKLKSKSATAKLRHDDRPCAWYEHQFGERWAARRLLRMGMDGQHYNDTVSTAK